MTKVIVSEFMTPDGVVMESPEKAKANYETEYINMNQATSKFGFWSEVLAFVFSLTFIIGEAAGLSKPWDVYIPVGCSLYTSGD